MWLPATLKFSKTRQGGYSVRVWSGKVATSLNWNSRGGPALTNPRYQITRFLSGCFTDLSMWNREFVVPNKATVQVFINMSIRRFVGLHSETLAGPENFFKNDFLFVVSLFSAMCSLSHLQSRVSWWNACFLRMKEVFGLVMAFFWEMCK